MKKAFENNLVRLTALAVVVFGLIFGVIYATQNWGKSTDTVTTEASITRLNRLYGTLRVNRLIPKKDATILMDSEDDAVAVLPDISQYPFSVNPASDSFLTIYASCEKAGSAADNWLVGVAEAFNQSGVVIDGQRVSVGVRNIPSDVGAAFIYSGKYTPDLFIPSAELWGDIAIGKGARVSRMEPRIAGNVAGVVLSQKKHDELVQKHGALRGKLIVDAIASGELAIGYTDALSSTEGLNFVLTALRAFDENAPLSDASVLRFKQFQDNIPYVAYDVAQLKDSALGGTLDGFVADYRMYASAPELKASFVFIPFGVRQDQPVYAVGELSALKQQIAAQFVAYCMSDASQRQAAEKGYNGLEDYASAFAKPDGAAILQAQDTWKKEKNGTRDLTAVFVADISGSMEGSPMLKLKASLNRAATVIDANTNIGLVTFSDEVNIALPIAKFDETQKAYFYSAVKAMHAGGATAMFDAIVVAEKMLIDAQLQNPNTKLMLFVLTDGETNRGYGFEQIEELTRVLRIPIYTIGYNADISVLQQISDINEATTMNAETDNVIYKLESLFNAQM